MDRKKFLNILPLIVWFTLLLLLWFQFQARANLYLAVSVIFYLVFASVIIVRSVEKQNLIKRFGLQSERLLILALLLIVSIFAVFEIGTNLWNNFFSVVLSPIPEEIFFRGYVQGRFMKRDPKILRMMSRKMMLVSTAGSIFVSSLIFAISHYFRYSIIGILPMFSFGLLQGIIFLLTGSILLPAMVHVVTNLYNTGNFQYLPSTQILFWLFLTMFPSILLLVAEFFKKRHTFYSV